MFQKDLDGLAIYCLSASSVEHVLMVLCHTVYRVTLKQSGLYVCEDWALT